MKYTALIVAAGSGSRVGLGYNKLLYTFKDGMTIIEKSMKIFVKDEKCAQIIIVCNQIDKEIFAPLLCAQANVLFVEGGATRQDSVYNGLQKVSQDYVLIHDGARPWLSMQNLDDIVTTLEQYAACLLMVPMKDTIKEVRNGFVVHTPKRSDLMQAQTPQAFQTKLIMDCFNVAYKKGIQATDDAQLVELCSDIQVRIVEGSYENRKVTTKDDLKDL